MAKLVNVVLLVVAAFAATLHSSEAENFTVGDSTGWIDSPSGGASFYSNWAANHTFKVNDVLVFNFVTGRHDVAVLTKANFDSCNVSDPIQLLSTSPVMVTLNQTGEFYFACAFPGHCSSGQKLSVNVTGSSSPSPPSEAPAEGPSGSSPTEPGATAPPPQGSATSLAATFSLLLTTIAVNLFLHF